MTFEFLVLLFANALIGTVVVLSNCRRAQNLAFGLLNLVSGAWLFCIAQSFNATSSAEATHLIMVCSSVGVFVPSCFQVLRLSVREKNFIGALKRARWWFASAVLMVGYVNTPLYIKGAVISVASNAVPEPIRGPLFALMSLYLLVGVVLVVRGLKIDTKKYTGLAKLESSYILLGIGSAMGIGLLMLALLPLFVGNFQVVHYSPVWVLTLNLVIAYGIATHSVLSPLTMMRRVCGYLIVFTFIAITFSVLLLVLRPLVVTLLGDNPSAQVWPGILASAVTVFLLSHANPRLRKLTSKFFVANHSVNLSDTMHELKSWLNGVVPAETLLRQIRMTLTSATGCDKLVVFSLFEGEMKHVAQEEEADLSGTIPALVAYLTAHSSSLSIDRFARKGIEAAEEQALAEMKTLGVCVTLAIKSRGKLLAVIGVGPRINGRVYETSDIDTLETIADSLSFALDNSLLYDEIRERQQYTETLIGSISQGLIACSEDGKIKTINPYAREILNLGDVKYLSQLPAFVRNSLVAAFNFDYQNREKLNAGNGRIMEVSSGAFAGGGNGGNSADAYVIFTDLTPQRELQDALSKSREMVEHTARAAHDIKNPLTTIRTMATLLPKKYDDENFRNKFIKLIFSGVEKIDGTVVEMLQNGSKEASRTFSVHEELEHLQDEFAVRAGEKGIEFKVNLGASADLVTGKHKALVESISNLVNNAFQAVEQDMASGKKAIVAITTSNKLLPATNQQQIAIMVSDSGVGIDSANLQRIFDPYFTTKVASGGTGLGLSLVHKIVSEANGSIFVDSQKGMGATFTMQLPVTEATGEVAA